MSWLFLSLVAAASLATADALTKRDLLVQGGAFAGTAGGGFIDDGRNVSNRLERVS